MALGTVVGAVLGSRLIAFVVFVASGGEKGAPGSRPLLTLGCMAVGVLSLIPFARERAPQPA